MRLLAGAASTLLVVACGAQGPPRPPRVERPAKVTDFSALQAGQTLVVHFTLPLVAIDGERLTKPLEIELLRGVVPQGTPTSLVPPFATWTVLTADQWIQYARGQELFYPAHVSDHEFREWQGQVIVVAIRTLTRGFRHRPLESDISNLVYLPLIDVSEPVQHVTCATTQKAIVVRWTPPTQNLTGGPIQDLTSYRVYRSSTGKPGTFDLAGGIASPPFADLHFEFGHTYFYKVRAVFEKAGRVAESGDSEIAEIAPRDTFPPAAPTGLTGIFAVDAVELVWTSNTESDLAGYNVYRREGERPFQKLTQELLRTPILRDATVEPSHSYSYYVTAVDLAGNESDPSKTLEVETR